MMKHKAFFCVLTTLLAGCATVQTNSERVATDIKDSIYTRADRIEKWVLTPPASDEKKGVPASYCYQSYQDILCYRQPMPGAEARLVGYQGTDAPAPQVAVMKGLPRRAEGVNMEPEVRAKNAKPLAYKNTDAAKPAEEPVAEGEIKTITIDAAHESLSDPTMAPQL